MLQTALQPTSTCISDLRSARGSRVDRIQSCDLILSLFMTDHGQIDHGPGKGSRGGGGYSSYGSKHRGGRPFKRQKFDNRGQRGSYGRGRGNFRAQRGIYRVHANSEGYGLGGNVGRRGDPADVVFDISDALSNPWKDLEDELGLDHCQIDIIQRTGTNIEIIPPLDSHESQSSHAYSVEADEQVESSPDVDMMPKEVENEDEISIDIENVS
ncbi:hypothetical protein V1525DRAFT_403328 [Lipomyces kononenkoae]|uniref:Uncharacterized protein n=1 Tax=Lipomyces kononenkoae TaxID=34357 RepID=A0ACC3T186_LIPKO